MEHNSEHTNSDAELDELFDAMRPRFISARRLYVRKRLGALMALPIIFGVGLAWASVSQTPDVSQVAGGGEEYEENQDPEPEASQDTADEAVEIKTEAAPVGEPDEVELAWSWVELGFVGSIQVGLTDAGPVLGASELSDGWTADVLELGGLESVVLVLTNGDIKLLATIEANDDFAQGEGDRFHVELDDITPEPEPDYVTRKEIEVGEVGRVVVERDGDELWLGVLWSHDWWKAVVVNEHGDKVHGYFTNDGVKVHVEAWIDGLEIAHNVWRTEPEPDPLPKEKDPEPDPEPEIQTRKEIGVGGVGRVVVEREGDSLWLGVLWSHQWWDAVIVKSTGNKVHAYFTNDGVEHHVRAWMGDIKIKHETWVVKPEIQAYDGTVSCGFGNVGILVEGNIARVMSVQNVEGVETNVLKEVGEVVRVKFITSEAVWIMEAWGNGEAVVAECGRVE